MIPISLSIQPTSSNPVVAFAAEELCRSLRKVTGLEWQVQPAPPDQTGWALRLGDADSALPHFPETASDFDDIIWVNIQAGQGMIAGNSPRALLLAVYRYLNAIGCRWVRPGPEGEVFPFLEMCSLSTHLAERPSFRHRAICIEGAVSIENVLELIDWAPKVGLSGYFMQFREGHTFFDHWYAHTNNPLKTPEPLTLEQARAFTRQIEDELARRGMLYHAVGHGWTCEAFGIPGLGWDPVIQDWPQEVLDSLALVGGKRAMWRDIPLITSLCFSNPEVRHKVVECVVEYVRVHDNVQALHFWLDDGFNNKCECDECRKMRPSDFYVMLLNELDAALTAIHYPGKIVFLAYADLLWAPEVERIRNPERFILMFAPITRSYRRPLAPTTLDYTLPPYQRNQLVFSDNNDEQLAFLRSWQSQFTGDSFIYDYHLWRPGSYVCDSDALFLARLLHSDIKNLKALRLDGMVSCQLQRIFFPTGLAMYVMGRALWDDSLSFEAIQDDYFAAAFGPEWTLARDYLLALSDLQDLVPIKENTFKSAGLLVAPQAQEKLHQGLERIEQFAPVIAHNQRLPEPAQARSWFYLAVHASLMQHFLTLLSARADGQTEEVRRQWALIKTFLQEKEDEIQPVLDVFAFIQAFDREFV